MWTASELPQGPANEWKLLSTAWPGMHPVLLASWFLYSQPAMFLSSINQHAIFHTYQLFPLVDCPLHLANPCLVPLMSFYSFFKVWLRQILIWKVFSNALSHSSSKEQGDFPLLSRGNLPVVALGINEPNIQLSYLIGYKVFDFRTCINSA